MAPGPRTCIWKGRINTAAGFIVRCWLPSGFAAARRIAKRVAAVREHNPEPTLESLRTALRDVIARCVYGVDVNPMAAELAKVSLWLEALEPGKPLSYLDQNIRVGNSLLGVTPALLAEGLPDAAFTLVPTATPTDAVSRILRPSRARNSNSATRSRMRSPTA